MTSAQFMPSGWIPRARCALLFAALLFVGLAAHACTRQRLHDPFVLDAPYARSQLWAVAPFTNESGVSEIDIYRVADLFTEQAQQVRGINTVPVNRVLEAMQRLNLPAVRTAADARSLLNVLDLDGLIVGTITAYDPYRPPKLGMAVELHISEAERWRSLDPNELIRAAQGEPAPGELGPANPVAQAAGLFDARHHDTLRLLHAYAEGRSEPDSAYGEDIYLVRMELFTQFACYRLIHDLLDDEQARIAAAAETERGR